MKTSMWTKSRVWATAVVLLLGMAASLPLAAQERKPARAPKVIQLEEVQIEGRVQKPNAFYILNRSNPGYEISEVRTQFSGEIVRAVSHAPF